MIRWLSKRALAFPWKIIDFLYCIWPIMSCKLSLNFFFIILDLHILLVYIPLRFIVWHLHFTFKLKSLSDMYGITVFWFVCSSFINNITHTFFLSFLTDNKSESIVRALFVFEFFSCFLQDMILKHFRCNLEFHGHLSSYCFLHWWGARLYSGNYSFLLHSKNQIQFLNCSFCILNNLKLSAH